MKTKFPHDCRLCRNRKICNQIEVKAELTTQLIIEAENVNDAEMALTLACMHFVEDKKETELNNY